MPRNRWKQLSALSWRERLVLIEAGLLLPAAHGALIFPGYMRTVRLLEKLRPLAATDAARATQESLGKARRTAQLVSIAARHGLVRANCLRQALALWWLLRAQGLRTEIRFGAHLSEGKLEGHAWVEMDGKVVSAEGTASRCYHRLQGDMPAAEGHR